MSWYHKPLFAQHAARRRWLVVACWLVTRSGWWCGNVVVVKLNVGLYANYWCHDGAAVLYLNFVGNFTSPQPLNNSNFHLWGCNLNQPIEHLLPDLPPWRTIADHPPVGYPGWEKCRQTLAGLGVWIDLVKPKIPLQFPPGCQRCFQVSGKRKKN